MIALDAIAAIEDSAALIKALEETYDNEEGVSESYVITCRMHIKDKARQLQCLDEVNALFESYDKQFAPFDYKDRIYKACETDRKGNLTAKADNFLAIMRLDPVYAAIRRNEVSGQIETLDDAGNMRLWTDADSAASRIYIEKEYGLHHPAKHEDAFECLLKDRTYNPIKDIIEAQKWDGTPRIAGFLSTWAKAEDTAYTREVSRLIFAGGIHRLYRPGCKFDDMAVLIGEQGCGKSTLVHWLAIQETFCRDVNEFEGQAGMEAIEGAWVCEVSELLAMTKAREQEAIKSYLTRQVDSYRRPYARYTTNRPRTCIFIGTTNREEFLVDKTGGRRFYPVHCGLKKRGASWLYDHREACMGDILQCWAEAYAKMNTPEMAPCMDQSLAQDVEAAQEAAVEDDYRVGMIEGWLEKTKLDEVCINMIWDQALHQSYNTPTRADCTQVGLIMARMKGWRRCDYRKNFGEYGKQRFWRRTADTQEKLEF